MLAGGLGVVLDSFRVFHAVWLPHMHVLAESLSKAAAS